MVLNVERNDTTFRVITPAFCTSWWHYWFVVIDEATELPILSCLLPSRTHWAVKFVALKLKALRKIPKVIITDGLAAYKKMGIDAVHQICLFHHQQGVTRWPRDHAAGLPTEVAATLKRKMKRII